MAKYTLADVAPDQTAPAPPAPRYTLADVAPGQTDTSTLPTQDDRSPAPSLSPSAQYSEPRGRNATMDQVEKSLPMIGAVGLGSLAGPEVMLGAGLAGAGALAGKSAAMLSRAARTGESPESPVTDALKEGGKTALTTAAFGGAIKVLGAASKLGWENGIKPAWRVLASKMTGANRAVTENVFNAAEDAAPSVAEAGAKFLQKVADARTRGYQALDRVMAFGKRAITGAQDVSLAAPEGALAAANATDLSGHEAALEGAKNIPVVGKTAHELADSAAGFAKALDDHISNAYDAAIAGASKTKIIPTDALIGAANNLERQHMVGDVVVGEQSEAAVKAIQRWKDHLLQLTGPDAAGIDEATALDLLKKLGKNTNFEGPAATEKISALRSLRHSWRDVLGEANPQLGQNLSDISKKIQALDDFTEHFGVEYRPSQGFRPTNQTYTATEAVVKGGRPESILKGSSVPGFAEDMAGASSRVAQEGEKEAAISGAESALKSATKAKGAAINEAESNLADATRARDAGISDAQSMADRVRSKVARFANQERPGLLDLRRKAEAAANAGHGSPQEQALVEMLQPYLGPEATDAATKIITGASKEMFGRKPAPTLLGRMAKSNLTPEAERLVGAIGKSFLNKAARYAVPVGAAAATAEDDQNGQ